MASRITTAFFYLLPWYRHHFWRGEFTGASRVLDFKNYEKFFQSKERYARFASYSLEAYSEETINIGVLGALAKRSTPDFEDALRVILMNSLQEDENAVWQLPVKGWTEQSEKNLFNMLDFYQAKGLLHLLCTDIARYGMLSGLNNHLYAEIANRFPTIQVQASGGVKTLQDIRDAKRAGAGGAILGRALLEGRFSLQEALAC